MRSSYTMQIFIVLSLSPIPSWTSSGGFRRVGENATSTRNTDDVSGTSELQSSQLRKQTLKSKRPKVHARNSTWVNLTKLPTNSKRIRLFGRVGLFLHVNANGTVSGSLNQNSQFVKFEIQSFGPSIVRVKNVETGKFLAINSKGILQTRANCKCSYGSREVKEATRVKLVNVGRRGEINAVSDGSIDCLFYQNHEENLFVSFASFKYYMREQYDMFLSIKRNGEVKQPTSTLPGQDSIQFIALNVDNWGPARRRIFG
ncbi:PREDICTED: fibroblast growth factor 1-like isoform X1 [Acropora digitifera]|uniref:fibroblast growth factor 1-like isoform X1 n=1 Tax=Acropora digitifera TaxID=70779 RepID=UPI00077A972D|nr:PREDICTED: fibroblast growth factor 1-like isoform X1 [Acropora digitifera]